MQLDVFKKASYLQKAFIALSITGISLLFLIFIASSEYVFEFKLFSVILFYLLLLIVINVLSISNKKAIGFLLVVTICCYFVRIFFAFVLYYIAENNGLGYIPSVDQDSVVYMEDVDYTLTHVLVNGFTFENYKPTVNTSAYSFFIGFLGVILNSNSKLLITFSSCFFGSLCPLGMYLLSLKAGLTEKYARISAILIAFFSIMVIIFSSVIMKDILVILLVMATFLAYHKTRTNKYYWFLVMVCIICTSLVRAYSGPAILAGILACEYYLRLKSTRQLITFSILSIIIIGCFALIGHFFDLHSIRFFERFINITDLVSLQEYREDHFVGGEKVLDFSGILSMPGGIFLALGLGLIYEFFSMFPWEWFSTDTFASKFICLEMCFLYILYFSAIFGIIKAFKTKNYLVLAMFFYLFINALFLALFVGNYGSFLRYRLSFYPVFIVLAGLGGFKGLVHLFSVKINF